MQQVWMDGLLSKKNRGHSALFADVFGLGNQAEYLGCRGPEILKQSTNLAHRSIPMRGTALDDGSGSG